MRQLIGSLVVPLTTLAIAPAAQAALFPPLKPSAAHKPAPTPDPGGASLRAVAGAAGRHQPAVASPVPTAAPTPLPPVAAEPVPEVVHPAVRLTAWRPSATGGRYDLALEADASLWQGDWGLGARVLSFQGAPPSLPFAVAGILPAFGLRYKLGDLAAGMPRLDLEVAYMPTGPAPGLAMVGADGALPLRGGWLALEAAGRAARGPWRAPWMLDVQVGLNARVGPASLGLGWRHLGLGWEGARIPGTSAWFTGPYASGGLAF